MNLAGIPLLPLGSKVIEVVRMNTKKFYIVFFSILALALPSFESVSGSPRAIQNDDACDQPPPRIHAQQDTVCSGQPVLLWAEGCINGVVKWSNGLEGDTIVSRPATTRIYTATCQTASCQSDASAPLTVHIPMPTIPVLSAEKRTICAGESTRLLASGCSGTVVWSNGATGTEITVRPAQTTRYTATCRESASTACISCFAEELEIRVLQQPELRLSAPAEFYCPGDTLTLSVQGCTGKVTWPDQTTGNFTKVTLSQAMSIEALCEQESCSWTTNTLTLQVSEPPVPHVSAEKSTACFGERVRWSAQGCYEQEIRWSNGMRGAEIFLEATQSYNLSAWCERGSCKSAPSRPVQLTVLPKVTAPTLVQRTNTCPFVTLDLYTTLAEPTATGRIEFRYTADVSSPVLAHPEVVGAGRYYAFRKTDSGCYSEAIPVDITIVACESAVPVCHYFPTTVKLSQDSLVRTEILVKAEVGGFVQPGKWISNGSGTFSSPDSVATIYTPSAEDQLVGQVLMTYTTQDPDGSGPCEVASAKLLVSLSASPLSGAGVQEPASPTPTEPPSEIASESPTTSELFVPDGFSPNNDGINDRFVVRNVPSSVQVSLEVYNRWGQLIYANADYRNDWNGTGQGAQEVADATYFVLVRLSDGQEKVKFITITR